MSELIIQSGKHQGKRLSLPAKEMIVGRDEKCDLRIGSDLVSRKHCTLKSSSEGIVVTDLGSQNGTFVNDLPITEATLLREGYILRIGSMLMAVPVSQKSKGPAQPAKVSDDEIADWLNDSGSGFSGKDTAVLRHDAAAKAAETPPTTPSPQPESRPAPSPAKPAPGKILSVKDEAAEVIRKHWEKVKAKKA
jgi:predicted component of type VI protein secretion system